MKRLILIAISILPLLSFGQDNHFEYKNALKISPFEFGRAEFQLSYERYFGEDRNSSIQIMPSVILLDDGQETKEGFTGMIQYRTYLSHFRKDKNVTLWGMHNMGFYAGLYALGQTYTEDYLFGYYDDFFNEYKELQFQRDITAFEGGAIIGVQLDVTKRIVLDFYIGGGIRKANVNDNFVKPNSEVRESRQYTGVFDPEYQGVKPKGGFQLGITL